VEFSGWKETRIRGKRLMGKEEEADNHSIRSVGSRTVWGISVEFAGDSELGSDGGMLLPGRAQVAMDKCF
jgi:hypothetical protein